MTKSDVRRAAEEFVSKHKDHYRHATKKDVKQAVAKVAKALSEVAVKEPPKTRAKSA
jgi:hypothetical protein